MQTIRTISNIAYNSPDFFEGVIHRLVKQGAIDWCYWIIHQPDTDETKPHIHFVLKPSKRVDTSVLREQFNEFDSLKPDKPKGCTSKWFCTNSIDDWLLYAVHDLGYLAAKNQVRNVHYKFEDIQSTDVDALRFDWSNIDRTKYQRLQLLAQAVKEEMPFALLVQSGAIPIAQRSQYEFQYRALQELEHAGRCGRFESHEFDPETGEVLG